MTDSQRINSSNRFGWDYAQEAQRFSTDYSLIDVHSHINGVEAAKIYKRACQLYGVVMTYSMTQKIEELGALEDVLEGRIRFISIPQFGGTDPLHDHGRGYVTRIEEFYRRGARIAKFWSAPRICDFLKGPYEKQPLRLNSPLRLESMETAASLGMIFMVHVSDPDTWFATKYKDPSIYGTKQAQYDALEDVLERFKLPLIAAHMGGWPEDLRFLSGLLSRHSHLYLDVSATKWIVRELSRQHPVQVTEFFTRWKGRLLFGSDIVTSDQHLEEVEGKGEMAAKASNHADAFDLYASRYWALRTMFEHHYDGESPIADPDLAMVDPQSFSHDSAPQMRGFKLDRELLLLLYHDAAHQLLSKVHSR
jgi:hypothetical protein